MRMKAPDDCTSAYFEGETYTPVDGVVTVPNEAQGALMSHGFTPLPAAVQDEDDEAVEAAVVKRRKSTGPAA